MVLNSGDVFMDPVEGERVGRSGDVLEPDVPADPRKTTSGSAAATRLSARSSNVAKKEKVSHNGSPSPVHQQPGREEVILIVKRWGHGQTPAPPAPQPGYDAPAPTSLSGADCGQAGPEASLAQRVCGPLAPGTQPDQPQPGGRRLDAAE
ncbi:unnamed protein product [Pleuronectes platessa]|uniref:Uncharacterized protein n=1 Tax=Pleuronectes platessa TaxID=8262 RepID=A0A9N7YHX6_PLEPL|nr:unnamed protein product [Pleuronectes platessa]